MDIQHQVCTKDQAHVLDKLGVKAKSHFYWVSFGVPSGQDYALCRKASQHEEKNDLSWFVVGETSDEIRQELDEGSLSADGPVYPAFTVAELGEMLPDFIVIDSYRMHFRSYKQEQNKRTALWTCTYGKDDDKDIPDFDYHNEAQARAALLIHLIESKLITPESINNPNR